MTIDIAQNLIRDYLGRRFDSHRFIIEFMRHYEEEYVRGLIEIGATRGAFRTYHQLIGRFLADNAVALEIRPLRRVYSTNIKFYKSPNMLWEK